MPDIMPKKHSFAYPLRLTIVALHSPTLATSRNDRQQTQFKSPRFPQKARLRLAKTPNSILSQPTVARSRSALICSRITFATPVLPLKTHHISRRSRNDCSPIRSSRTAFAIRRPDSIKAPSPLWSSRCSLTSESAQLITAGSARY
jgi:hypothetical protein